MCQYAMDAAYEGRKDINDMNGQLGLEVRETVARMRTVVRMMERWSILMIRRRLVRG